MINKLLYISCVSVICILCASCASLKCEHFPGTQEMITQEKLSDKSIWKLGEVVYHVKVANSSRVVASWVEWDDSADEHTLKSCPIIISKLDETLFLNFKIDGFYTILRIIPSGEHSLVLLTINPKKVEEDIESGVIKGSKENGEYKLDCTKQELESYITANLNTLFAPNAAGVLNLIEGKMKY